MIAVESMRQWHSLIQWFQDNRFADKLSGRCFFRNKFDAIFRTRTEQRGSRPLPNS